MNILIYQFPGSCSRVTMTALEEIGLDFEDVCVNLQADEQKAGDYLAINPKAKVPAMAVDGRIMTENAAILAFLHNGHRSASLLPVNDDPVLDNQGLADLIWCASTLHPMVRQVRAPFKLTKGDPLDVRRDGIEKFAAECEKLSTRIGANWWYGDSWSIVDTYLYWAYSTAEKGEFPLADYPVLVDHARRVRARPSFQRALKRELAAAERHGIPGIE